MIEIRPLTKDYLFSVEAAEREIFSDPWGKENLESHLHLPYQKSYVALSDGAFCGYFLGTVLFNEGEVLRIATLPHARKRGVGKKLLSHFLQETKKAFLEVRKENLPARALYEKLGFTVIGSRKNYYKNPEDDAVLYQYENKGTTL